LEVELGEPELAAGVAAGNQQHVVVDAQGSGKRLDTLGHVGRQWPQDQRGKQGHLEDPGAKRPVPVGQALREGFGIDGRGVAACDGETGHGVEGRFDHQLLQRGQPVGGRRGADDPAEEVTDLALVRRPQAWLDGQRHRHGSNLSTREPIPHPSGGAHIAGVHRRAISVTAARLPPQRAMPGTSTVVV
jgi:hypothetical protein